MSREPQVPKSNESLAAETQSFGRGAVVPTGSCSPASVAPSPLPGPSPRLPVKPRGFTGEVRLFKRPPFAGRASEETARKVNDYVSIVVIGAGVYAKPAREKLSERLQQKTTEHVVKECLRSKAKQVIVVCGGDYERVKRALRSYHCRLLFDKDFAKGQSFSIRKGLAKVKRGADAVVLLLSDGEIPSHSAIDEVIDEYSTCYAPIVTYAPNGGSDFPILFDKNLFDELKSMTEEQGGLGGVLLRHRSKIRLVETSESFPIDLPNSEEIPETTPVHLSIPRR